MNLFERFSKAERAAARASRAEFKSKERAAKNERQERLDKAAGVGFGGGGLSPRHLALRAVQGPHACGLALRLPLRHGARRDPEPDAEGLIHISLSGPNLVKLLAWMWSTSASLNPVERALAKRIYNGAAAVVDTVDPSIQPGLALPPIIIDDRVPPPG